MLNPMVKDAVPAPGYDGPMDTMGDRIRTLREARRMSQPQLAAATGVTKSAVSQWESGETKNIKLNTFLALVEVLQTDFEYLVYGASRSPDRGEKPARSGRTGNG
jgi:transcriptional regulator with XRE-family HTH domain